jgi:small subunit ribosomal protein S4
LREKQKLRLNYGLSEKQLRRTFKKALASKQPTGDKLVELLERRLDCLVFRAGFAPTIPSARQLVNHGHFNVNGRRARTGSMVLKAGDTIEVRQASRELAIIEDCCLVDLPIRPDWLDVTVEERKATVKGTPDSAPFPFDAHLVVEFYSRIA